MNITFSEKMSKIKGSAIREIFKVAGDPSYISLAGGNPSPDTFPNVELSKIAEKYLAENPVLSLQYGVTEGYMPLREAVKNRLRNRENIGTENDDLIIVSGGQQGIELCSKCLLNEGDVVIVEEPSFIGALNCFRSFNAKLVGVSVEEDGMNIEELESKIAENDNVKIIYTIPTFQNPSGNTMSLEKRKKLYEVALKNNIIIIEDNPYGELTFDGEKVPTIKSFDTEGIVLYAGSFSKVLAPGMRIGFCMGCKELIGKMVVAKQVSDVHTPMITQLMAYEFIENFDLDGNIEKARMLYAHKCDVMIKAMDKHFPDTVKYTKPKGGIFIWCTLPEGFDSIDVSKECMKEKVVFVPGSTFMVDMEKPCNSFRLNYSTMDDERIEKGIEILGKVLTKLTK